MNYKKYEIYMNLECVDSYLNYAIDKM